MKKMCSLVTAWCDGWRGCEATAQDAAAVIDAAARAMGTSSLQSIQYSGTGSVFMLGQNVRPDAPWPQFTVTKYNAGVRYDAPAFREELVRIDTENPPRGGGAGGYSATTGQGGMRPIIGEQTQVRQGTPATDDGLPAGLDDAARIPQSRGGQQGDGRQRGRTAHAVVPGAGQVHRHRYAERSESGRADRDARRQLDARRHARRGGVHGTTGITTASSFQPGSWNGRVATRRSTSPSAASSRMAPRTLEVRVNPPAEGGGPAATSERLGDGIWVITAGLNSVLVEFADHLVVIEALGNDARSHAVIAEVKRLVPSKPLRYLVNTHAHFDHSGGVRAFAAEGATIVTHDVNKPFMEKVLALPHRINPDSLAKSNRKGVVEGFGDKRIMTDAHADAGASPHSRQLPPRRPADGVPAEDQAAGAGRRVSSAARRHLGVPVAAAVHGEPRTKTCSG